MKILLPLSNDWAKVGRHTLKRLCASGFLFSSDEKFGFAAVEYAILIVTRFISLKTRQNTWYHRRYAEFVKKRQTRCKNICGVDSLPKNSDERLPQKQKNRPAVIALWKWYASMGFLGNVDTKVFAESYNEIELRKLLSSNSDSALFFKLVFMLVSYPTNTCLLSIGISQFFHLFALMLNSFVFLQEFSTPNKGGVVNSCTKDTTLSRKKVLGSLWDSLLRWGDEPPVSIGVSVR